jgi:adenylate cyclase
LDNTANTQIQQDLERLQQLISDLDEVADRQQQTFVGTPQSRMLMEASAEFMRLLAPAKRTLQNLERRLQLQAKERQQFRALQEVSSALNSSLDTDEVLNLVMDTMIQITGAERGFLMLMNENTGDLEVRAARNINRETIDSAEISSTILNSVFESGEPLVTTNAQEDDRFSGQQSIISYNLRSILCVPLRMKADTIGVIYADNRVADGIFRDSDRDLMTTFANQAAVAIENARLFQQIRDQLAEITEMKTLMDDVFESIASGVITINNTDHIKLYNRAAGRILGVPMHLVVEQPYQTALSAVSGEISDMVALVKQNGGHQNRELDLVLEQRTSGITINLTLAPLLDVEQKTLGVTMVMDDISEKKRIAAVRRYLPPALVDQVRDLDAAQRPQRRDLTVFFADVSSFSTFSERLDPEDLIRVINGYFTVAADALNEYEGIIDKFMGDAVMALFNTQLNPMDDHVARAVRAGLKMRTAVDAYRETLPPHERLFFSAGIHTGEAVAGNVGSPTRKDFTAIGDAVNLAKRLEETATAHQIMISSNVYEVVKDWVEVEAMPPMRVKGREALEQTYLLIREK